MPLYFANKATEVLNSGANFWCLILEMFRTYIQEHACVKISHGILNDLVPEPRNRRKPLKLVSKVLITLTAAAVSWAQSTAKLLCILYNYKVTNS